MELEVMDLSTAGIDKPNRAVYCGAWTICTTTFIKQRYFQLQNAEIDKR